MIQHESFVVEPVVKVWIREILRIDPLGQKRVALCVFGRQAEVGRHANLRL
jgi:hypothetical protein